MGLDVNGTKFLLYARTQGVDFATTATIGHQGLNLTPSRLRRNLAAFGLEHGPATIDRIFSADGGFAGEFIRHLGAREVHAFDASPYEGATHIHDLNRPIGDAFKGAYSFVLDGGSLEHVFDVTTAFRNCMEMVRVGGHFAGIAPGNNLMGHGFYQFSPELYFNLFRRENGYEIVRLLACEDRPRARWFAVRDPRAIRERVTLVNRVPLYLLVLARRVAAVPLFQESQQQSDYQASWDVSAANAGARPKRRRRSLRRSAKKWFHDATRPLRPVFDRRFFEPMDPLETSARPRPRAGA